MFLLIDLFQRLYLYNNSCKQQKNYSQSKLYKYILAMFQGEEVSLNAVLSMIQHHSPSHAHLFALLSLNTSSQFYTEFITIGNVQAPKPSSLEQHQKSRFNYFIDKKIKALIDWQRVDCQRFLKSCQNLNKMTGFRIGIDSMSDLFPNIIDVFTAIDDNLINNYQLKEQFIKDNMSALYDQMPNTQTYSYKCMEKMNEEQKKEFQILSVNHYSTKKIFNFQDTTLYDKMHKHIYQKYIATGTPALLSLLMDNELLVKNIIDQILILKLMKQGQCWILQGSTKVNKVSLTPSVLIKCLQKCWSSYNELTEYLFIEPNQEEIVFKYDILSIDFNKFQLKLKQTHDEVAVNNALSTLMANANKLMNAILKGKKLFIFNIDKIQQIPQEKADNVFLFCLKLFTFPFRLRFSNKLQQNGKPGRQSQIKFEIPTKDIKQVLQVYFQRILVQQKQLNIERINRVCQICRWLDETDEYKANLDILFSKQSGQDRLNRLFAEIITKIAQSQNKPEGSVTHLNYWTIRYFQLGVSLDNGQSQCFIKLCKHLYHTFCLHIRINSVWNIQLRSYSYLGPGMQAFYQTIQRVIHKNVEFCRIIFDQWMQQLLSIQTDQSIEGFVKVARFFKLAFIFIAQHFPTNEEIKKRLRDLICNKLDLEQPTCHQFERNTWKVFVQKIDLNKTEIISKCLENLQQYINDQNFIAQYQRWQKFQKPKCVCDFFECLSKLRMIIKLVPPTDDEAAQLNQLVFKLTMMKVKYKVQLETILEGYTKEELKQYFQLTKNHGFRNILYKQLKDNIQFINKVLKESDLVINNNAIMKLDAYLRVIIQNFKDVVLVSKVLEEVLQILQQRSQYLKCSLFIQFYHYHKSLIVQLLATLLNHYKFVFKRKYYPLSVWAKLLEIFRLKSNEQYNRKEINLQLFQKTLKRFINYLFINNLQIISKCYAETSLNSFICGNVIYENIESSFLFKKSIQNDFIKFLISRYRPEQARMCKTINRIIKKADLKYNPRYSFKQRIIGNIEPNSLQLVFFKHPSQVSAIAQNNKRFIRKMFELSQMESNTQETITLFNILRQHFSKQQMNELSKQLLQGQIQKIEMLFSAEEFNWMSFYHIHSYISLVLDIYEQSIGSFISTQFLEKYLDKIVSYLKEDILRTHCSEPFMKFIQRLLPHKNSSQIDPQFKKFVNLIVMVYHNLEKLLGYCDKKMIQQFIGKLIEIKKWGILQHSYEAELFQNVVFVNNFSQYVCCIAKDQLQRASIQLEIKCYLLKQQRKVQQAPFKGVRLQKLASTFSLKYKNNINLFIEVAQKILVKKTIKQQDQNVAYLLLKPSQELNKSSFLQSQFMEVKFSPAMKSILYKIFDIIGLLDNPQNIKTAIQQLRVIAYNYPILIPYIIMHPCKVPDKSIPFIDFIFQKITNHILDIQAYDFLAYICLDFTPIMKLGKKCRFFSQYLCYRLQINIMETELTQKTLLLVFNMVKVKKFCEMCSINMKDNASLCQRLWQTLKRNRNGLICKDISNVLIYSILSIIYRGRSVKSITSHTQSTDQKATISSFFNQCLFPFHSIKKDIISRRLKQDDHQQMVIEGFKQIEKQYGNLYLFEANNLKNQDIIIKQSYLQNIGIITHTPIQSFFNVESHISKQLLGDQKHDNIFNTYHLKYDQQAPTYLKQRSKHGIYQIFSNAQQKLESSSISAALETKMNQNNQSRFAPPQFEQNSYQQMDNRQNSQIELFQKLNKLRQLDTLNHQSRVQYQDSKVFQCLLNSINQRLRFLHKAQIDPNEIQGGSYEQRYDFLQLKDLQTNFDFNLATLSMEQFKYYCLSNTYLLEKLDEERKGFIKFFEESSIASFIQSSTSQFSIDDIIDTIDENYQYLNSNRNQQLKQIQRPKKKHNIRSEMVSTQYFQNIPDEFLLEIITSVYYDCYLIPVDYFIPFLENKIVQEKIINTLLYICQNPFRNQYFPTRLYRYDQYQQQWSQDEPQQQDFRRIRQKIIQILTKVANSFYDMGNYLSRMIGGKGINNILFSSKHKIQQFHEKYSPIENIIGLKNFSKIKHYSEQKCQQFLRLLKSMQNISDFNFQKVIQILNKIYKMSFLVADKQIEIGSKDIDKRIQQRNGYDIQNNLKHILTLEKFAKQVRNRFPLQNQKSDAFFVSLLMKSNVYSRQQLLRYHKQIILKDKAKSGNIVFANLGFALYTDEQLKSSSWIKQSKNIIPSLVQHLPLKESAVQNQPFLRICKYHHLTTLQYRQQVLSRRILDFHRQFKFKGSKQFVAFRLKGIFQSAFYNLRTKPNAFWYEKFDVKFVNEQGAAESGNGNGVGKDWYSLVTKGMVNLNYALFAKTSKNYYFFNRDSWINPRHLQYFEFIGKLFACAVINRGYFLTPSFSIVLYKLIVGEEILIEDIIAEFDQGEVIRNVEKLMDFEDDSLIYDSFVYEDRHLVSQKDVNNLLRRRSKQAEGATQNNNLYLIKETIEVQIEKQNQISIAEINEIDVMEQKQEPIHEEPVSSSVTIVTVGQAIELIPGGSNVPVTIQNREQFITLTKKKVIQIIVEQARPQFNAFMEGFSSILKPQFLQGISAHDLREIAEGCDKISIEDLRENVSIDSELKDSARMEWFWECLQRLSFENRAFLIQHWTGLPKIPAEGFKGMQLKIVKGRYDRRLFAQTCFNTLHLAKLQSRQQVQDAIMMAINLVKKGVSIIEN